MEARFTTQSVLGARISSAVTPSRLSFMTAVLIAVAIPMAIDGGGAGNADASAQPVADSVTELTPDELDALLEDPSVDVVGGLIRISEPVPFGPPTPIAGDQGASGGPSQQALTQSEVFQLNSRPGAERTILLDFDGQVVTSPHWNSGAPIDAAAFSNGDQNNESFSEQDRIAIVEIWERVAEDFAAWDVNVTTQDPGEADLSKNWSVVGDPHGVRVVITPSYTWYDTRRFGGVAYVGSFDANYDLPAWVFSSNLSNGNAKSVAEAASHEVGHALGLYHDGVDRVDDQGNRTNLGYYSGHGDWAPIMGIGYYRPVTQWSRGEYNGATNTEDDLAIIDTYLDRIGPTAGSNATQALGPGTSSTEHVITNGGEIATHIVDVGVTPMTITVDKLNPEGNLLAELQVHNQAGQTIASATPSDPSSWTLEVTLPAGTPPGPYVVDVISRGWIPGVNAPASSSTTDEGFSDYSSIGGYRLTIDVDDNDSGSSTTTTTTPGSATTTTTTVPGTTPTTTTPTNTTTTTTTTTTPTTTVPPPEPPAPLGERLTAISPQRLLDTRQPTSPVRGPLRPDQEVRLSVQGVPDGTTAVVLNVTAAGPTGDGFISLTPCAQGEERTSSLNYRTGRNVANSVIVPLSPTGEICVMSSQSTQLVLDVTGFVSPEGGLELERLVSKRVVDTRIGVGLPERLAAGSRTVIPLLSEIDDSSIRAVSLNVTAVRPASNGFLTIDDCSGGADATSSLNFTAGDVRGNNGVFALGRDQRLCIFTTATTEVTIDVTGEFGTDDGLTFVAATSPDRLIDTRSMGRLDARTTISFDVANSEEAAALERTPVAASLNLTAAGHEGGGFVTSWNCAERPTTSALNPSPGVATANGALAELTSTGRTCLFHATGGHLIVDLAGWWI
ncbi:MAG: zinc-dependent metalloprotease family protein [Ilumatobacter sp.]